MAYKKLIIDKDGKRLSKPLTDDQKKYYTLFDRLCYNIKRTINKIPGGGNRVGSTAAALWLLKENFRVDISNHMDMMTEKSDSDNMFGICEETFEPILIPKNATLKSKNEYVAFFGSEGKIYITKNNE